MDCGCKITPLHPGVPSAIQFRPLHAAAEQLRDALKDCDRALSIAIRLAVDVVARLRICEEEILPDVGEHVTIKKVRAALAAAEGKAAK
jgi:hypothetical protein